MKQADDGFNSHASPTRDFVLEPFTTTRSSHHRQPERLDITNPVNVGNHFLS
jgi:hypothetical protein